MPRARYTGRAKSSEPLRPRSRLSLWRKAIDDLPPGLVDRLRRAQPEARAELFRRYAPQVRRILFLQGFCEEVDDAVQEVFIKVFRADIPAEQSFLAWFYRVILNTGRDQGRRRKTRFGLLERLQSIVPESAEAPSDPADKALREALATLSPELRECVALRFFADLSLDQIAAAQSVPVGTVKSRLHGAMKHLRAALTARGFVHDDR
jgi:RNA polymerase sigma-70 factor, ECF subfamily